MSRNTPSLYDPYFTEEERRDLELVPHDDLTGEIYLQRYLLVLILSKSPPEPLEFELLLEKTRACNLAIRSLISLIYAEMELRKGKKPEWKQFVEAAHLLAAEQMGIVEDVFPDDVADAIRSGNPYWRRHIEMESSFDTAGESPGSELAPGSVIPPENYPSSPKGPDVKRDTISLKNTEAEQDTLP